MPLGRFRLIIVALLTGIVSGGVPSASAMDCSGSPCAAGASQTAAQNVPDLKPVTDTSFAADVLKSAQPVLVNFWAEWCGPCRQIMPSLRELAGELDGKLTIVNLNIDENSATPVKHGVRSIPTLMLFKDGRLVATKVGALPKKAIADWVRTAI